MHILVASFFCDDRGGVTSLVLKSLRVIVKKVNVLADCGTNPIDQVAWVSLQKTEQHFVNLLVQNQDFRNLHVDVF